jgi:uncharacterized protein HemX
MKKVACFILLGALTVGYSAAAFGRTRNTATAENRASQKANRKQQKAQKKYAKAQRKAERKMLKTERKNTTYPTRKF